MARCHSGGLPQPREQLGCQPAVRAAAAAQLPRRPCARSVAARAGRTLTLTPTLTPTLAPTLAPTLTLTLTPTLTRAGGAPEGECVARGRSRDRHRRATRTLTLTLSLTLTLTRDRHRRAGVWWRPRRSSTQEIAGGGHLQVYSRLLTTYHLLLTTDHLPLTKVAGTSKYLRAYLLLTTYYLLLTTYHLLRWRAPPSTSARGKSSWRCNSKCRGAACRTPW